MGVATQLVLRPSEGLLVRALLSEFLPGVAGWAYGSRVTGGAQSSSDLDLVVFSGVSQGGRVEDLREAFEESDLPFRVDCLVWSELPVRFQENIAACYYEVQAEED